MDYNSMRHNQERHKDFVREAERDRLARKAARAAGLESAELRTGSAAGRRDRWLGMVESLRCHFAHFRYNIMTRAGLRREPAPC